MRRLVLALTLLLPSALLSQQRHIPIRKDSSTRLIRDSIKTVHDTVWKTRVETLTVYREKEDPMDLRTYLVQHDTVRDTVKSRSYVPVPIPLPLCISNAEFVPGPTPASTAPEPGTFLLVGSGVVALVAKRFRRKST